MCYILCMCVCGHQIRQLRLTIPLVVLFVSCVHQALPRGVPGGGGERYAPPGYATFGAGPKIFFGRFFLF
jgi:hypothetical protein